MISPVFSLFVAFSVPTIQGTPSSLLTIAAWQVFPPRFVTIADAIFIAGTQSGVVISVTRTSPFWKVEMSLMFRITLTFPDFMPGLTPIPLTRISLAITLFSCFFSAAFSPAPYMVSGRACSIYIFPPSSIAHSISWGLR